MFRRSLAAAAIAVATLGAGAASAEAASYPPVQKPPVVKPVPKPPVVKVVIVKPGVTAPKSITVGGVAHVHVKGFKKNSTLTVKVVLPNHKTVVKHVKTNSKGEATTPSVKVTKTGKTVVYVTGVDAHNKKHTFRSTIVVKAKHR
jgi:hypothetical protein